MFCGLMKFGLCGHMTQGCSIAVAHHVTYNCQVACRSNAMVSHVTCGRQVAILIVAASYDFITFGL